MSERTRRDAEIEAQLRHPLDDVKSVKVADVERQRVEWLWRYRLARGKLHLLDGDPGQGKSNLTRDLAAKITTASPMPDGSREQTAGEDVVLLSAEDGPGDTIRPSLEAAGADLERVHLMQAVHLEGKSPRLPSLPADIDRLGALIAEHRAALCVIDPLTPYLHGSVDAHRDQDIRRALHPLAEMADRTGVAVVGVRHLSKSGGARAMYRGGGSIALIGAARVGLLAVDHPDGDGRSVLAVVKNNLAPIADAIVYRLVADECHGCARVRWEGSTGLSADALLAAAEDSDDDPSATDEAAEIIVEILSDGPVRSKEVERQLEEAGVSLRTAARAKKRLGARSVKQADGWVWKLPDEPKDETR